MDLQLSARTAFVTGASQGIGRAIAKSLATLGEQNAIAAQQLCLTPEGWATAKQSVPGGQQSGRQHSVAHGQARPPSES